MDLAFEIIYNKIDPVSENHPEATKEQLVRTIYNKWRAGKVKILCNDKRRVVHVVVLHNFKAGVHVYAESQGPWDIVISHKQFLDWFENQSDIYKLEADTRYPVLAMVLERTGWTFEGIRTQSSMDEEGNLVDKYLYGRIREERYE